MDGNEKNNPNGWMKERWKHNGSEQNGKARWMDRNKKHQWARRGEESGSADVKEMSEESGLENRCRLRKDGSIMGTKHVMDGNDTTEKRWIWPQ